MLDVYLLFLIFAILHLVVYVVYLLAIMRIQPSVVDSAPAVIALSAHPGVGSHPDVAVLDSFLK